MSNLKPNPNLVKPELEGEPNVKPKAEPEPEDKPEGKFFSGQIFLLKKIEIKKKLIN